MDYEKIQPNGELRANARRQLQGVWGEMAFTYFLYSLLFLPYQFFSFLNSLNDSLDKLDGALQEFIFNLSTIFPLIDFISEFSPVITLICFVMSIAVLVTAGPFVMGFAGYFIKRVRGETIDIKNIFDGFKLFSRSFGISFFTALFTGLWSLLLLIPGIVKALAYSMAYYIMYDDPKIDSLEAIKKSQIMMKGYKWKLFLLELSFIGWTLLCLFTLGIGFYWLFPYVNLSLANFYENLKRNQEKNAAQPQAAQTQAAPPPVDLFQAT